MVSNIEQCSEALKQSEDRFFALAERFRTASDRKEIEELGDEIGRFIFGA